LRIHERRRVFLLSGVLICGAAISLAQTESTPGSSNPGQAIPGTSGVSPFAGSVPAKLVPGVMPLSLQDAISRGLKQNLGLLLSRADIRSARGQRWEQLSALLPHVTAAPDVEASKINLSELGLTSFGGITLPRSVGAFSYFDARAAVAQTLFDWKSINATRAASQSLKSAAYSFKDARDLVVLAVGYVYLQAIADEARIDTAEAQVKTAQALYDEGGKEKLLEFVKNHTHDESQPDLVVHEGVAADSILSFAQARETDLIVMGTHGRRGFDRVVLGSVTDPVMRTAPCPALAISRLPPETMAAGEEQRRVHHLNRILFCTDFSEASERALNYALSATAEYDAELTLLHVLEEVPSPAKTEDAIATATRRLDKLIPQEGRKTLKIKTRVRIGKPYTQIIQFLVDAQIDMVAMGVSGRGALDRAVFGSTTYRVMQLGACPVLAVHV